MKKIGLLCLSAMCVVGCSTVDCGKPAPRRMPGKWCSCGTSITWYNNSVEVANGRFTRGYQDRVRDVLQFDGFVNCGYNGGIANCQWGVLFWADYYTIEHGINDWGHSTKVGTLADYVNDTKNGTFGADMRVLVDRIRSYNPKAKIIFCTPRRGYGFEGYLPDSSDKPKNGIRLVEYVELIRRIAEYEKAPVADFFATCGTDEELPSLSIDVALHPNDAGYQRMADELVRAFLELKP